MKIGEFIDGHSTKLVNLLTEILQRYLFHCFLVCWGVFVETVRMVLQHFHSCLTLSSREGVVMWPKFPNAFVSILGVNSNEADPYFLFRTGICNSVQIFFIFLSTKFMRCQLFHNSGWMRKKFSLSPRVLYPSSVSQHEYCHTNRFKITRRWWWW